MGGQFVGGVVGLLVVLAGGMLKALVLGYVVSVLVGAACVLWLFVRTGLGVFLGVVAASLLAITVLGRLYVPDLGGSIVLMALAALAMVAWLTDPGWAYRRRRGALVVPAVLGIAMLGSVPPVLDDLRTWRRDVRALRHLVDPPLVPDHPDLDVRELRVVPGDAEYVVADSAGVPFASVRHQRVDKRPVVSDDCFSVQLGGPPMVGCAEVAPGVYRAEYRSKRSDASFFVPRENTVVTIREYVSGTNLGKYGEHGAGDENLLRVATSLRPVPAPDLARRVCWVCRLIPG